MRVSPYDDMVVERNADYFASFYEPLRLGNVFLRRRGISARMVVRNYHRHRAKPDRLAEDVAWMQKGLICSATRHDHWLAEKTPLRVKIEGVGAFLRFVDANRLHLPHNVV